MRRSANRDSAEGRRLPRADRAGDRFADRRRGRPGRKGSPFESPRAPSPCRPPRRVVLLRGQAHRAALILVTVHINRRRRAERAQLASLALFRSPPSSVPSARLFVPTSLPSVSVPVFFILGRVPSRNNCPARSNTILLVPLPPGTRLLNLVELLLSILRRPKACLR